MNITLLIIAEHLRILPEMAFASLPSAEQNGVTRCCWQGMSRHLKEKSGQDALGGGGGELGGEGGGGGMGFSLAYSPQFGVLLVVQGP